MEILAGVSYIILNPKAWYVIFDGLARVGFLVLSVLGIISLIRGGRRHDDLDIKQLKQRYDDLLQDIINDRSDNVDSSVGVESRLSALEEIIYAPTKDSDDLSTKVKGVCADVEKLTERVDEITAGLDNIEVRVSDRIDDTLREFVADFAEDFTKGFDDRVNQRFLHWKTTSGTGEEVTPGNPHQPL